MYFFCMQNLFLQYFKSKVKTWRKSVKGEKILTKMHFFHTTINYSLNDLNNMISIPLQHELTEFITTPWPECLNMETDVCFITSLLDGNGARWGCSQQKEASMNGMPTNTAGFSNLSKASASTSNYFEDTELEICHCCLYTGCSEIRNTRCRTCSYQGYTGESLVPQTKNEIECLWKVLSIKFVFSVWAEGAAKLNYFL